MVNRGHFSLFFFRISDLRFMRHGPSRLSYLLGTFFSLLFSCILVSCQCIKCQEDFSLFLVASSVFG
jgi:hypothetical protein